jgi:putative membrane protein
VEQSGFYTTAQYRGALGAALITFIGIIVYDKLVPTWGVFDPIYIFSIVVLGCVAGAVLPQFIMPLKRFLVGQKLFDRATRSKAENAFLEEEVFNTRHRTGIMIFISFFEREVIVMADRGINKVVDQKEWDNVVRLIINGIAKGKLVDGLEKAIARCGEILLEKGFTITPDDVNELRDDLRIE